MRILRKPYIFARSAAVVLVLFTTYVLLDTFVIPHTYHVVETSAETPPVEAPASPMADQTVRTDTEYRDDHITITITPYREYNTDIYVADITVDDSSCLKTAFARGSFGRNIVQYPSAIAENNHAILAVNGDFYGARQTGYVIRNGVLYRADVSDTEEAEALVIDKNGDFSIVRETDVSAQTLLDTGAQQVFSFGPGLIENGTITATAASKVRPANPRTAIGQIGKNHYIFAVADGRTEQSAGLRLEQMAAFLQSLGVHTAYNLDGGGSSALYFNGKLINHPTADGKSFGERTVSDIVYIR